MTVTRLGSPPKAAMFSCQDDDRQGGRERLDDDGCQFRGSVGLWWRTCTHRSAICWSSRP